MPERLTARERVDTLICKLAASTHRFGLARAARVTRAVFVDFGRRIAPSPPASGWVMLSALIGTFFYVRIQTNPSCCDAVNYLDIAGEINANGLFSEWPGNQLRTYFYPWFLSVVAGWAREQDLVTTGLVFLLQLVLHIAACLLLNAALRPLWPTAAAWSLPLLLCNPLLLAYVPDTLTESLTISLTILWFAVVARLARALRLMEQLLLWGALGAVAGTALMVRPANVVLIPATAAVALVLLVQGTRGESAGHRATLLLLPAALMVTLAVPMLPQLKINVEQYETWSVFPTDDLGGLQLQLGVEHIKYVTDVRVGGQAAPYLNPFLGAAGPNAVPEPPIAYYWQQPFDGVRLVALHLFNSVNPDFLFTYVHDAQPWYRTPLVLAMQALFYAGITALFGLGWRLICRRENTSRAPFDVGVIFIILGSMALNAFVRVETRYGVVTVIGLSVAVAEIRDLWRGSSAFLRSFWLLGLGGWLALSLWLTEWVLRQAPAFN